MSDKTEKKKSIAEIVAIPALTAGAGALIGGVAGGAATRSLLDMPGINSRLGRMARTDPARKERILRHLQSIGAAGAGTAGAVGSYALSEYIKDQMEKRKSQEKRASLRSFLDDK
jgi:hypothetical protein